MCQRKRKKSDDTENKKPEEIEANENNNNTAVQEEVQITENGENPTNRQTINVKPAKKPAQPKHLPQAAVPQKPHQEEVSHSGKTQHETTSTTGRPQRRAKQKFLDNLKIINKQQKRRRKRKNAPKKAREIGEP